MFEPQGLCTAVSLPGKLFPDSAIVFLFSPLLKYHLFREVLLNLSFQNSLPVSPYPALRDRIMHIYLFICLLSTSLFGEGKDLISSQKKHLNDGVDEWLQEG